MTTIEQCKKLYNDAFGEEKKFDTMLFDLFSDNIEYHEQNDIVSAMYFKIPCLLNYNHNKFPAFYIYAVTTHKNFRHQGIMSKLFNQTQSDKNVFYFLKPSSEGVIPFYEQLGFKKITGTRDLCDAVIEVDDKFKKLSSLCDKPLKNYTIMINGNPNPEKITFEYTLE